MANVLQALSTPTLVVNNVVVAYVPGSLSYTEGTPEKKVRTQSSGGGAIQRVVSVDLTTQFSDIKFQLLNTAENIESAKVWVNNGFENSLSLSDIDFTRYGANAAIVNKYEVMTGIDGNINIEFMCDSVV